MGDRRRARRLATSAAVALAIGAAATGCSSGTDTADSLPGPAVAAPTTTVAPSVVTAASTATTAAASVVGADPSPTVTVAAATATTAAAAPVDAAALLQGAVAAMAAGYHFTTTLTINGAVVLSADGDRVGDGTRLGVTQGDVAVQYVITPDGTWVQPDGGDWQQLDSPAATTDPIAALASPTTVTVASVAGTATTVTAAVPPAALGLAGDTPVDVSATIDNGAITTVGYSTSVNGQPAVMQASIGPVADATPVTAPI
ncbi:MAG: hypothetical protein JWN62_197 [Acidimicrobiales bacterium]|nr:hypothetical protein [Acidimicrobiales bacterium]